jgi:hypothetical protein
LKLKCKQRHLLKANLTVKNFIFSFLKKIEFKNDLKGD